MTNAEVLRLSSRDKVAEALRRSLPYVPAEARNIVQGMLSPTSLGIVAGTLVAWAGSHFFGIGEIVDAVLLVVGVLTAGLEPWRCRAAGADPGAARNSGAQAIAALRFPIKFGYVTVSQLAAEGQAIGTIVLGATLFKVSLSLAPMPEGE